VCVCVYTYKVLVTSNTSPNLYIYSTNFKIPNNLNIILTYLFIIYVLYKY